MKIERNHILKLTLFTGLLPMMFFMTSCEQFLEAKPDKKLATPSSFKDLQALLDAQTMNVAIYPSGPDIASDDYYLPDNTYKALAKEYRDNYVWDAQTPLIYDWRYMYNKVFTANVVLDEIDKVKTSGDSPASRTEIEGAALFYRAFAFYQLLQTFTLPYNPSTASTQLGIPLRLKAALETPVVRSNLAQSYEQVIADLKVAAALLPVNTLFKTRPSKPAAYGLLARTFLVMGKNEEAYHYADSCLLNYSELLDYKTISTTVNNPFTQFNKEVIFHSSTSGRGSVMNQSRARVDTMLYNSYTNGDLRKVLFYKAGATVGRVFKGDYAGKNLAYLFNGLATDEVMLIKAEAAIRIDKVPEGMKILNNLLVKRWAASAYQDYSVNMNKEEALAVVLKERRKELAFRGGLRWADVRRLHNDSNQTILLQRKVEGTHYLLEKGDKRFAFLIPEEVIQLSGIAQNER